jgi:hypothetical protein
VVAGKRNLHRAASASYGKLKLSSAETECYITLSERRNEKQGGSMKAEGRKSFKRLEWFSDSSFRLPPSYLLFSLHPSYLLFAPSFQQNVIVLKVAARKLIPRRLFRKIIRGKGR